MFEHMVEAACRLQRDHLHQVSLDPRNSIPLRIVAETYRDLFDRAVREGQFTPDMIDLSAADLAARGLTALELAALISPAFLGLFAVDSPVIAMGLELKIDLTKPECLAAFLLESVLQPLGYRYGCSGPVVAAITGNDAWANVQGDFYRDPDRWYQVVQRTKNHYWSYLHMIARWAQVGGVQDLHLVERSLLPSPTILLGGVEQNLPFTEQLLRARRDRARVLLIQSARNRRSIRRLTTAFLGRDVGPVPHFGRNDDPLVYDHGEGGVLRRVICTVFLGPGSGAKHTYRQQVAYLIREALDANGIAPSIDTGSVAQ